MTAEIIPTPSRGDWIMARRRGVTASEIATVMGLAPDTWADASPYALHWRKRGELPEPDPTDEMTRGQVLEPYVVTKFLEHHPEYAARGDGATLYRHPHRSWQMCTPDRLLYDFWVNDPCVTELGPPVAGLETKTAAYPDPQHWGDDGTSTVPVHYELQCQWSMDIFGLGSWWLACQFMTPWHLRIYQIYRDGHLLGQARQEAREFLDNIDLETPPPIDWRPATTRALKQLHPKLADETAVIGPQLARRWQAAATAEHAARDRRRRYENLIRAAAGPAARITLADGTPVATHQIYDTPARTIQRKPFTTDKLVPARGATP